MDETTCSRTDLSLPWRLFTLENKEWNFNWEPSHTENARHSRTIVLPYIIGSKHVGEGRRRGGGGRERGRAGERKREREGEREGEKRERDTQRQKPYRLIEVCFVYYLNPSSPLVPVPRSRSCSH